MSEEHTIIINADGTVRFVWDDALADLCALGRTKIVRAADVEPTPDGAGWMVDCQRVGGGVYGPYRLREHALQHERAVVIGRLQAGQLGGGAK